MVIRIACNPSLVELGRAMAALGQFRRLMQSALICGALAATPPGASAAGPPDPATTVLLGPPGNSLGEGVVPEQASIASDRAANLQGDLYLGPTPADVKTVIQRTLSLVDLQTLVGEAAGGADLATDPRVRKLGAELELREDALARILAILGHQDVPPERLADALAEIVARHKSLLERVRLLEASEPRAAELRDAVAGAIETAEYDRVDALLIEAEALGFEAMRQLLEALDQRILAAAAIDPEAGGIAGTRRHSAGRAGHRGPLQLFRSGRFCNWHPGHHLCERWAQSFSLCERLPKHPLCDDDRFCKKRPDHPLCDDDPPPSPS
jgi:hypothetical protein